jgi:hypothetical protein
VKRGLSTLTNIESELLYKGPLLVCILMAGADGKIDDRELAKAIRMAKQQQWVKSVLAEFFRDVAQDFEDKLQIVIQSYPTQKSKRENMISEELERINLLWNKLEPEFSAAYLEMLRYLARKIAESSGKFWARIDSQEAELVDLPMLKDPTKK